MCYILFYEKAPDHATRSVPYQATHLAYVRAAAARGELLLAGNLTLPDDGTALLLFSVDKPETVEAFARGDIYVKEGIVVRWRVRQWDVVVDSGVTWSGMDEYLEANRQLWDSWARINLKSSLYDVEGFAVGRGRDLDPIVRAGLRIESFNATRDAR